MINIAYCWEMNYGDCLNLVIMPYLIGKCQLYNWQAVPRDKTIYLGIGTLVDYMIRLGWFRNKDVVLLGTGTNNFGNKIEAKFRGFARGKLSGERLGVEGIGDLGILVDRVMPRYTEKNERLFLSLGEKAVTQEIIDSLKCISPNITTYNCNVCMMLGGIVGTFRDIAASQYVVSDKLHFVMTAEALGIPWLVYHHHEGTLFEQPDRYRDWADMVGKSEFIISDLSQAPIIKENTNFDRSEKQKDKLEKAVREVVNATV